MLKPAQRKFNPKNYSGIGPTMGASTEEQNPILTLAQPLGAGQINVAPIQMLPAGNVVEFVAVESIGPCGNESQEKKTQRGDTRNSY
jgi:hypothetical protein